MPLQLSADSRVFIDLRSGGLLGAVGHSPTLEVPLAHAVSFVPPGSEHSLELPVAVSFRANDIQPPAALPPSEQDQMRANLRGPEVLDVARFPLITFAGKYSGNLAGGSLSGGLTIRGIEHLITLDIAVDRQRTPLVASGAWEGRLTELGIKPFRALLGAIRLADWVRLRMRAVLLPE